MNQLGELFSTSYLKPPHLCVEMSGNHQGKLESALAFASKAKAVGADSLKVQVYKPETITIKSRMSDFRLSGDSDWASYKTLYDLYQKAHTPWEWVEALFKHAKDIELPIFASPFDPTAVEFLENLDCQVYKIASPEITDLGLIDLCAQTRKPVIISTGLASREDIDIVVELLRERNSPFMILKCVSAYPTPLEDMNVSTIPWLENLYQCPVGLSDHTLGKEAAFSASALGARLIEKHFKFFGDAKSVDSKFSMPLENLSNFKKELHAVFFATGSPTLDIPEIAKPSLSGRRSLYVVSKIKKGDLFTAKNVRSIRPSYGIPPKNIKKVLGRRATRDLEKGERFSWDMVDGEENGKEK